MGSAIVSRGPVQSGHYPRREDGLPHLSARISANERWRLHHRFGDLGAAQLQAVLDKVGNRGELEEWADLVEYALGSDDHIANLNTTRLTRVVQADWIVVPNEFGDRKLARKAARFVDAQLGRIRNWSQALRDLLHAIPLGYAASELEWQRDISGALPTNYVQEIHFRHPHRFRYDNQWQLRLYDRGERQGPDGRGEMLRPMRWIVHQHREQAGYPGIAGVMRSAIWRWMFRRWVDKWRIANLEVHGDPFVYGRVPPDTPDPVRDRILRDLEQLTSERRVVMEEGVEVVVEATAQAVKSYEAYAEYMDWSDASLTKAWLGISDATDPGASGSRAAVETRVGAVLDPRMISDGENLGTTLHGSLFRYLLEANTHHFDNLPISAIPVPMMRFKTADDEAVTDVGDLEEEREAAREAGEVVSEVRSRATSEQGEAAAPADAPEASPAPRPAAPATPGPDIASAALNGAQVTSLLEIVTKAAAQEIPRATAVETITAAFPTIERTKAEAILGEIGRGFEPATEGGEPGNVSDLIASRMQAADEAETAARVQSVILDKAVFPKQADAVAWVLEHDYRADKVDETEKAWRFRQRNPGEFETGSLRTIEFADGIKAVVGRRKRTGSASLTGRQQAKISRTTRGYQSPLGRVLRGALDGPGS